MSTFGADAASTSSSPRDASLTAQMESMLAHSLCEWPTDQLHCGLRQQLLSCWQQQRQQLEHQAAVTHLHVVRFVLLSASSCAEGAFAICLSCSDSMWGSGTNACLAPDAAAAVQAAAAAARTCQLMLVIMYWFSAQAQARVNRTPLHINSPSHMDSVGSHWNVSLLLHSTWQL